jgi:hypothetical protein
MLTLITKKRLKELKQKEEQLKLLKLENATLWKFIKENKKVNIDYKDISMAGIIMCKNNTDNERKTD